MLDTIARALQDLGRQVLPTLPSLSQEEVSIIWGNVSEFVRRQLTLHKGVQIPAFGTFTFIRQKLEVGNNKFILIQRPVFIMVEKLVQIHGLKQNKVYTPGEIPIVPLNFVMISLEGPFNRDVVEGCVKETLLFLSRSISMKQNVEFTFKGIGVLMIRDSKVKMRFYKDFLCTMDGSGALAKALANRPGTVDSVLSSREALRKWPSSVLAFPRIELKEMENKLPMETLVEECGENRERKCKLKDQSDKEEGTRDISSPKRLRDRQALFPAKVTNVSLLEKFERSESGGKIMTPESLSYPSCLKHDSEMKPQTSPACQDHNKAGQEMCYVCLQRAQRNSLLYYSEERRREIEDERLIQQYQMLKDQEALFRHQMKSLATREQNQKNAAYNLGVAEAIRNHKNEKPEFYKSFLFDKRPLSPALNALKQEEYSRSLLKQMDNRQENEIKQRQYRELMDRLEQVQLTEELAAQRAKFLKDKMEETQCYKRALDAQIKNKPSRLPPFEPDSSEPIFGKNEGELMVEKQKREQNYMKHQLEAAANHKRKAILHQLVDQRRDLQMLQRTQREHLADRTAELERVNRVNQCLQEDWERSAAMKKQRDLEDKAFERASDKLFLLDQCEKYRRCKQCQRRTSNVGESNLWPLNKFLPGSRLLV
ncbi:coiled-coil domain containing 81 [Homo sapiens]|uniref:Coiled-coil domain-containing protein 81 n=2 Tax=Homo sapiens TaxID=9606 RepID=CCD81_HUMAN|nr:coiled-coil domain-containing protein 81 isoform 1 [Homo sapiens]Q6ZN84.2 RecName: Full=Coiled-coil domain-containing protein 81 [Homo sapiens]AAI26413.1 CCDC81 protein [Homo sapiens]KAI2562215.1 coiled-coil domain containing 81 [Homo sapiens]KAI4073538.1 coiled-coil domain containing 81 [Homo sapiens]|eukprot:NP_001149946.1 coiled-coil domain-containing protein 81 isoform 1 [Homo sapiens]